MTNLEKITQIDNMAQLLYDSDAYGEDFCIDCPHEDDVKEKDCLECIKSWLRSETKDEQNK